MIPEHLHRGSAIRRRHNGKSTFLEHPACDSADTILIVDDENRAAAAPYRRFHTLFHRRYRLFRAGKEHLERSSVARLTVQPDGALVSPHNAQYDGLP